MKNYRGKYAAYLTRRYGDRSTPKHYLNDLDMFIQQVGSVNPSEVTMQQIDEFIDKQQARGLKAATINRRLASIHTFFEFMTSEGLNPDLVNPVQWRRHRIKEGSHLPRDASEADVARLFATIEDKRDKAMFGLMVGAGLRVGEVVSVQQDDMEPPLSPGGSARLRVRGKGQKERIVWLTPHWYEVVTEWLAQRPESRSNHLFLNQHRRALSVAGVQYRLRQVCQCADIQITCHQLRHTFARRLAEQQMPTESIAELMGHEQVSTTQRYTSGANLALRNSFLAAMAQLEQGTTALEQSHQPHLPSRPARRVEKPNNHKLRVELDRLATLPDWVAPVLQRYLRQRWQQWQPHVATRLVVNLSSQLLRLWRWLIQARQIDGWADLQRSDLEAWILQRQSDGVKANTIRTELSTLKACFREAMAQQRPVSAHLLRVKPPKKAQPLPRYLTTLQMKALTETVLTETVAPSASSALARAWFLALAHTGVRMSELLNLRLSDVDFHQQHLFIIGGKNGNERIAYMTPALSLALGTYLQHRPATDDDYFWLTTTGSRLTAASIASQLHRWGAQCDVHVTPHRLRHTFATQLVNQGMPLATIAKLLGHQTLNMTQHYARLYEHVVKEQFETAMTHIEGILAVDWPRFSSTEAHSVEHFVDSV